MKEGIIKFNCEWLFKEPLPVENLRDIISWRNELYKLKLIGVDKDGIGYGNISIRHSEKQFIISGSQTGNKDIVNEFDFTLVTSFNISENYLKCEGPVKASSESLTHAAVYSACTKANAVIHIHNFKIWKEQKNKAPATPDYVEYGTPELANEITKLLTNSDAVNQKILVMGGHYEGILIFGNNIREAGEKTISLTF